uniref:Uncharacterized protein n=1 Tax=Cacopsylla melanoneura TaxID=428564 RepID=A0A8D8RWT6_9HEMI
MNYVAVFPRKELFGLTKKSKKCIRNVKETNVTKLKRTKNKMKGILRMIQNLQKQQTKLLAMVRITNSAANHVKILLQHQKTGKKIGRKVTTTKKAIIGHPKQRKT